MQQLFRKADENNNNSFFFFHKLMETGFGENFEEEKKIE